MEQKTDEQGKIARGQPPTNIVTVITHVRVYENGECPARPKFPLPNCNF